MTQNSAPTFDQVVALKAHRDSLDSAILTARSRIPEAVARKEALLARAADLRAAQPPAPEQHDGSLVDALTSDPTAQIDADALVQSIERTASHRAATEQLNAAIAVVEQAAGKIDVETAAIDAEVEQLLAARKVAEQDFQRGAHGYLVAQFRTRFVALRDEIMEPLLAFQYLDRTNQTNVLSIRNDYLSVSEHTSLTIDRYGPQECRIFKETRDQRIEDKLYPQNDHRSARVIAEEVLARFVASIDDK